MNPAPKSSAPPASQNLWTTWNWRTRLMRWNLIRSGKSRPVAHSRSPRIAAQLFGEIAQQSLNVDLIIQSIHDGNTNDIAFTVMRKNLAKAEAVAEAIAPSAARQHLPTPPRPKF
jgi:ribosomal protein L18